MLEALIKSPDALVEAMIEARSQLVAADEALQPYAVVQKTETQIRREVLDDVERVALEHKARREAEEAAAA